MTRAEVAQRFAAKAGCNIPGPQRTAAHCWLMMSPWLTPDEKARIGTAWNHVATEGRAELDSVMAPIVERLGADFR